MTKQSSAAVGAVVLLMLAAACVKTQKYVIPRQMPYGWILIDYNRRGCPSLPDTIIVPASGYVCTSSAPYTDLSLHLFYVIDERGDRRRLERDRWIHQEISISGERRSYGLCDYSGEAFYYGPAGTLAGGPEAVLIRNRSDCRTGGGAFQ